MMPTLNALEWLGVAMLFGSGLVGALALTYWAETAWERWSDRRWEQSR